MGPRGEFMGLGALLSLRNARWVGFSGFPPFPQREAERMGHPFLCGLTIREKRPQVPFGFAQGRLSTPFHYVNGAQDDSR
jgi:hypothetical protein